MMKLARHDPARKVYFTLALQESGGASGVSWGARGEARFALLPAWDLPGIRPGGAEMAFERIGSFAALGENEVVQFYAKEVSYQGSASDSEGSHSWSVDTRDGTTVLTCGEPETDVDDSADISDATLRRTASGADLSFRWLFLDACRLGYGADLMGSPEADWRQFLTFHLTNEELRNWDRISKSNQATLAGTDAYEGATATLKATLTTRPVESEVEVEVEASADYEAWIPEGNLGQPREPGNRLEVRLSVHEKNDPSTPRRAKLELTLAKVSMEKGVCLNSPAEGGDSDYDLKLLEKENPSLEVEGPDKARTKEAVESVDVVITAYDFGGYGILHVSGTDLEGRDVKVRVRGEEKADLALPFDDNHNHVADAWETKWTGGLQGQETTDGDELPAGKPGCRGDGLALYEEYRGFRITGGPEAAGADGAPRELITGEHVRTDPRVKDLFVSDQTSGEVAAPGIEHFGRSTRIRVHRLTSDEIGADRVVNRNAGGFHVVDQHGILIVDGPAGSDPEQIPLDPKSESFGPPGATARVVLPAGGDFSAGDALADVAHELSHAVGLRHHGDDADFPADWFWQLGPDGSWQLHEQRIQSISVQTSRTKNVSKWVPDPQRPAYPIQVFWEPPAAGGAARPFQRSDGPPAGSLTVGVERWRVWVGGEGGMFSGDQGCLMRYYDKQAYLSQADPGRTRYLPDKSQWRMRDRLCESRAGTGVNEPSHKPQSRYGNATVGDCESQVVVNDSCGQ